MVFLRCAQLLQEKASQHELVSLPVQRRQLVCSAIWREMRWKPELTILQLARRLLVFSGCGHSRRHLHHSLPAEPFEHAHQLVSLGFDLQ